jgi:hypothetical protein
MAASDGIVAIDGDGHIRERRRLERTDVSFAE